MDIAADPRPPKPAKKSSPPGTLVKTLEELEQTAIDFHSPSSVKVMRWWFPQRLAGASRSDASVGGGYGVRLWRQAVSPI